MRLEDCAKTDLAGAGGENEGEGWGSGDVCEIPPGKCSVCPAGGRLCRRPAGHTVGPGKSVSPATSTVASGALPTTH